MDNVKFNSDSFKNTFKIMSIQFFERPRCKTLIFTNALQNLKLNDNRDILYETTVFSDLKRHTQYNSINNAQSGENRRLHILNFLMLPT